MPARDGNRSPRDDRSWGSRAKDFVICAEAALRGKKGDPYPLNNSSLGRLAKVIRGASRRMTYYSHHIRGGDE